MYSIFTTDYVYVRVRACVNSKNHLYDFMNQNQNLLLEWVPTLAVAGVLVSFLPQILIFLSLLYNLKFSYFSSSCNQIYVAAFSIGLGPVPWVIMSEVCII